MYVNYIYMSCKRTHLLLGASDICQSCQSLTKNPFENPPMTRRRATTITGDTTESTITPLPLTRFISLGVEEAVDKERALQEFEAERRHRQEASGKGHKSEHEQDEQDDVYDRFSKRQKKVILFIVAFAAFLGRK
jgi:hypothetical protein